MASRVDRVCRNIILTKFFTNGWGNPDGMRKIFRFRKQISKRETCMKMVDPNHKISISKESEHNDYVLYKGEFISPANEYLADLLPEEIKMAHFQMVVPKKQKSNLKPFCIHLAGTGDHGFWRRRTFMAKPLLQEHNITSLILENPFYGCRKPKDQTRSSLRNVSDIFLMGGCLVMESVALLHWAEKQGYGPLGITGVSMGGHMASLAASAWYKPISLIPCLSWSTASGVFTQGVMSGAINWNLLKQQYYSNQTFRDELFDMIHSPEGAFQVNNDLDVKGLSDLPSSPSQMTMLNQFLRLNPFSESELTYSKQIYKGGILKGITNKEKIVNFKPYISVKDARSWEVLQFMRGIMDECTHLGNFSQPVDPNLIIIVAAENDAYVPNDGFIPLTELWPGSEVRKLNSGHITACLFQLAVFRQSIYDSFQKAINKYYSNPEKEKSTHSQ